MSDNPKRTCLECKHATFIPEPYDILACFCPTGLDAYIDMPEILPDGPVDNCLAFKPIEPRETR